MVEQVFFKEEEILVSSTRIVLPNKIIASLTSGETEYIDIQEVDDIQSVYNAISIAIVLGDKQKR